MPDYRFIKQLRLGPGDLNLSEVSLDSEQTSESFSVEGYNILTIYIDHTNNSATRVDVNVDVSPYYIAETPVWYDLTTQAVGSGTATAYDFDGQRSVSGDDKWVVRLSGINAIAARVRISSTGGAASDLASVHVIASFGPV